MPRRFQFNFQDDKEPILRKALADREAPVPFVPKGVERAPAVVKEPQAAPGSESSDPMASSGNAAIAAGASLLSGLMGAASKKEQANVAAKSKATRAADETQAVAAERLGASQQNAFGDLMARWKQAFLK